VNLWVTHIKDNPSRGDLEKLRLELELVPGWAPGRGIEPPWPAMMVLAPPGGHEH
jgi:hypothetical protein